MKKMMIFITSLFLIGALSGCSNSNPSTTPAKVNAKPKVVVQHQNEKENTSLPQVEKPIQLQNYNGPIEHIFFHPLVIYPELAFDNDYMAKGYNDWFVTVKEFNKILDSLYAKNYILIRISDIFEEKNSDGKMILVKKQLMLPKDKKPLILSVDDINYYQYMIENGNAYKLIIDQKGELATYSKDLNGNDVISEDNDIVPLLNRFVKMHPDFSLNGAKGILALTGYEGILGYRTNDTTANKYEQDKKEALKVVQKLKEDGWEFASHGYGHLNTRTISMQTLQTDTLRWKKEVEPLIGKTNIYIYPFGSSVLPNNPKFSELEKLGFNIFCSVGPNPYLVYTNSYVMMDRAHIDGIALEQKVDHTARFFNRVEVIDSARFNQK